MATNGCWAYGAAVACGAHQTCAEAAGSASCKCKTDPVCSAVGSLCANTSTLASCAQDAQGCFYEATSTTCTNGACSAGACCTNACTSGVSTCLSTTQIQSCAVGANGCAVSSMSACGSALVCEGDGSLGCIDPAWAEWPIVDTPSYTDHGDGTVTDNGTGLIWQQSAPSMPYAQTAALAICAALNLGGSTHWRLPSAVELVSIVDPGAFRPSINATAFPGTPPLGMFWSSTTYAAPNDAFGVSFLAGAVSFTEVFNMEYVRCVR